MVARTTAVPSAASRSEPLDVAFGKRTSCSGGVFVFDAAFEEVRHGCNAGMGMQADVRKRCLADVEDIQENKRLEHFSQIRGAHQPGDGAVSVPAGSADDLACLRLDRTG